MLSLIWIKAETCDIEKECRGINKKKKSEWFF